MKFYCAGRCEQIRGAEPIGVGMHELYLNFSDILKANSEESICFIGTAGSYGAIDIGTVVEADRVGNCETGVLSNDSYTPLAIDWSDDVSRETLSDFCKVNVNSSCYITSSSKLSKLYLSKGYQIENMEYFAFVQVAKKLKIKPFGLFVVTNYTFEDAHSQYLQNYNEAVKRLETIIEGYR